MKRCRNSPCGGVVMILAAFPFGREPGRDLAVAAAVAVALTVDLTMYAFLGIGPAYDVRSLTASDFSESDVPVIDRGAFFHTVPATGCEDDFAAPNTIQGRPWQSANYVMSWILLVIASLFEVAWAVGLKFTDGFTRLWPTMGTGAAFLVSVTLLGFAVKSLPIGTAYAVWTGIGAAGTVICGIVFLGDPATPTRLFCAGLILAGVIGLKLS